jgi:uncharacterized membrane protein
LTTAYLSICSYLVPKPRRSKGVTVPEDTPIQPAPAPSGLSDNAASGLAYVTFIPAIIFLVTAPYNQKPLVRFHSWQSIFLAIAWFVIAIGLRIVGMVPFFGLLTIPIRMLIGLGFFVLWLVVLIKTFNGQMFKIPVIGDLAEKQANS